MAQQPNSDLRSPHFDFSRSHTVRNTQKGSSERVISPLQRPLPAQHTTNPKGEHLGPQRDSNPRSQQSSGFRPTPQTTRPLGSAL